MVIVRVLAGTVNIVEPITALYTLNFLPAALGHKVDLVRNVTSSNIGA